MVYSAHTKQSGPTIVLPPAGPRAKKAVQRADKALMDAAAHPRWIAAISRMLLELDTTPWIERRDHGLIIGSPSGKCYVANGVCQCQVSGECGGERRAIAAVHYSSS
jgi:hypothetical protein